MRFSESFARHQQIITLRHLTGQEPFPAYMDPNFYGKYPALIAAEMIDTPDQLAYNYNIHKILPCGNR